MKWISVKDKKPDIDVDVFYYSSKFGKMENGYCSVGYISSEDNYWYDTACDLLLDHNPDYYYISHWMPLPELPKN